MFGLCPCVSGVICTVNQTLLLYAFNRSVQRKNTFWTTYLSVAVYECVNVLFQCMFAYPSSSFLAPCAVPCSSSLQPCRVCAWAISVPGTLLRTCLLPQADPGTALSGALDTGSCSGTGYSKSEMQSEVSYGRKKGMLEESAVAC